MPLGYRSAARVRSKVRLGLGETSRSEPSTLPRSTPNGLCCVASLNGEDFDEPEDGCILALSAIGRLSRDFA
jgi:hypothetical protein